MIVCIDQSKRKVAALVCIEKERKREIENFIYRKGLKKWKDSGKRRMKLLPQFIELIGINNIYIIEKENFSEIIKISEEKLNELKYDAAVVDDEIFKR